MPEVQVVLVNPLYEGNVGSTARVMKNFGWTRLALVDPCRLGNEAKAMASHAQDVLANARRVTLDEVVGRVRARGRDHGRGRAVGLLARPDALLLAGRAPRR